MSKQLTVARLLASQAVKELEDTSHYGWDKPDCSLCGEEADYYVGARELSGYRLCKACYAEWLRVSRKLQAAYKDRTPQSIEDYWLDKP